MHLTKACSTLASCSLALLAALLPLACSSAPGASAEKVGANHQALILDAAHGSQVPGFWFLAPFVDVDATFTFGTFAAAATPNVRIDQVDASGNVLVVNVATFTSVNGPSFRNRDGTIHGEHIRVHLQSQALDADDDDNDADTQPYDYVRWDADDARLVDGGIYRAHVFAPVLGKSRELGYADILVVHSQREARRVDSELYVPLVNGHSIRLKFRIDTTAVDGCLGVTCTALDQCHAVGKCNSATGTCSNPNLTDGTGCNDGDKCTLTDSCQVGACVGANPVSCTAGSCDPSTGACPAPPPPTCTDESGAGAFGDPPMAGQIQVTVPNPNPSDLAKLLRNDISSGYAVFFASTGARPPGVTNVEITPNFGLTVEYGPGTTYGEIISALNNWAVTNLSARANIASLMAPGDANTVPIFVFGTLTLTPCGDTSTAIENVGPGGAEPPLFPA
jgi:hypothetical protein